MASVVIAGDVSGTCTLQAANAAGTTVLTLPTTSGTVLTTASTTGINASAITSGTLAVAYGGTGVGTSTGSGNNVLSTSPTLTTPIVATTMGVGGATPAASGSGITFPATQSASTDANTLDDYEEGTWTPVLTAQTTAPTGVTYDVYRYGRYTKIGRMVYARATIVITSKGTGGVGDTIITGLPFAAGDYSGYAYVPVECIYYPSGGITGNLFGVIIDNNTLVNLSSATTPTNLTQWGTLSNSEKISINVVYQV